MFPLIILFGLLSYRYPFANGVISEPSDPYYMAGVIEFPSLPDAIDPEDIRDRIRELTAIIEASNPLPDIVVFPESVLNNLNSSVIVPTPQQRIVPCANTTYDYIITEISCYARSLQLYILINVIEHDDCTISSTRDCLFYNTNVVFDRGGAVISRYRKYNLIGTEWQYLNYTDNPVSEATFTTDFNVTFGHFTRMDLLYYNPAQSLVDNGITNFLHPSKWPSELPFMTAMSLHQSWAYQNNVNLLVAGANNPLNGQTGTGIYAGHYGALIASMTTDQSKKGIHLSVIPKEKFNSSDAMQADFLNRLQYNLTTSSVTTTATRASVAQFTDRITGINVIRDNDIDLFTTLPLNAFDADNQASESTSEVHQQICHDDLCCNFRIKRSAIVNATLPDEGVVFEAYHYRMAAFKGLGKFLNTEPDAMGVCALFACIGDHLYTCARIHPEDIIVENRFVFDTIEIIGNFSQKSPNLMLPISTDGMLQPLSVEAFAWTINISGNTSIVNHTLLQPKADVLTFGIYVNYFVDDTIYDQHDKDVSCTLHASTLLLIISIIVNSLIKPPTTTR